MKHLKLGLIALLAISGFSLPAQAAPLVQVAGVRLTGMKQHSGKALTVFYVAANRPVISSQGSEAKVRAITAKPLRLEIPSNGVVNVPSIEISYPGTHVTNMVVFAVHSPSIRELYLRNLDHSMPNDPRLATPDAVKALSPQDFEVDAVGRLTLHSPRQDLNKAPAEIDFSTLLR